MHVLHQIYLFAVASSTVVSVHAERNFETIRSIYNLTVYPNNLAIHTGASNAIPPGLFNTNATGRITPVGNFTGFTDSVEYFFALAPIPSSSNNNLAIYKSDLVQYTSGCRDIAASVVYLYAGRVDPTTGNYVGNQTTILVQVLKTQFDHPALLSGTISRLILNPGRFLAL